MLLGPLDSAIRVHLLSTSDVDITTDLVAGLTLDGVVLGRDYLVVLAGQTLPAQNGVYEVPLAGIAPRHKDFKEFANLVGIAFHVMLGSQADKRWLAVSDPGGVIDVSPIVIEAADGGDITAHLTDVGNPHSVTKAQVGLGSADDTADVDKPVSTAQQAALDLKFDIASLDTDPTGAANSDSLAMSQKAVLTLASTLVAGTNNFKASVVVATTIAGTLATDFDNGKTINGVVLATGNRILIKDQAAPAENGVYIVQAAGAPVRSAEMDTGAEVVSAVVPVIGGTVAAGTLWIVVTPGPITLGTTGIEFTNIPSAGSYAAGAMIDITANVISVVLNDLIAALFPVTTLASLLDIGSADNTVGKVYGRTKDDEFGRTYKALGSAAADQWMPLDDQSGENNRQPV